MTYRISIFRIHFLVDEIVDGDYYSAPNTYTESDHAIGNASELARVIRSEGLTFEGADWASNPDGSYTANYATGEEVEVSAYFPDTMPERLANAIRRAVNGEPVLPAAPDVKLCGCVRPLCAQPSCDSRWLAKNWN